MDFKDTIILMNSQQQRTMGEYLHILEVRAVIEDVDLFGAL